MYSLKTQAKWSRMVGPCLSSNRQSRPCKALTEVAWINLQNNCQVHCCWPVKEILLANQVSPQIDWDLYHELELILY